MKSCFDSNESWINFPYENKTLEENVKAILRSSRDFSKGVGKAAVHGAVMGAAMGAMSTVIQQEQLVKKVNPDK